MKVEMKNAYVQIKLSELELALARMRPFLTSQGISRLIQLQAGVKGLGEFVQPQIVVDENVAERGVYNNR